MTKTHQQRRSRYKRSDPDHPTSGRYQHPGDSVILSYVHDYRYLIRPYLELLTGRKGTSILRRLRFLYDSGYLAKVHFSRAYRETGSTPDIYVLDERGREEYKERTGNTPLPSALRNQNKDLQLEHTLLINKVRTMVEISCRNSQDMELVTWQREGKEITQPIRHPNGQRQTVSPDGFFIIRVHGKVAPFFLEVDRSTMDRPRFLRKLHGYYSLYRSIRCELNQQHGIVEPKLSNKLGIKGFRVLTVVEQETTWQQERERDRFASLLEGAATIGEQKRGWRGAWFTTADKLILSDPISIFTDPVWNTAYQEESDTPVSIL